MTEYILTEDPINQRLILIEKVNQKETRRVFVKQNDEERITKLAEHWNNKNGQQIVKFFEDNVVIKFGL